MSHKIWLHQISEKPRKHLWHRNKHIQAHQETKFLKLQRFFSGSLNENNIGFTGVTVWLNGRHFLVLITCDWTWQEQLQCVDLVLMKGNRSSPSMLLGLGRGQDGTGWETRRRHWFLVVIIYYTCNLNRFRCKWRIMNWYRSLWHISH